MFLEPRVKKGWIEVICGSMFSGKTEELIRRLKRAKIANQSVQIFKPTTDTRYDKNDIVSHDDNSIKSTPVNSATDILFLVDKVEVVGVDEAQFFDDKLPEVCQELALRGIRVIVAGLDMDYKGKPFGPMPNMLAVSEYITKLHAICMQCGDLASHSFRKNTVNDRIMLGSKQAYEPRCRKCYHAVEEGCVNA